MPTVIIGMVGGLIVGMTSVGSGSLMIVLLLFVYPMLGANQLVGTDLTQAVPLTIAAALGALTFGHVELPVTTSIVIGSVPAVLVGSFLSSRAPDRYIRPAITFVIFVSGLKYVGVGTTTLGWIMCATLLAVGAAWIGSAKPWRNHAYTPATSKVRQPGRLWNPEGPTSPAASPKSLLSRDRLEIREHDLAVFVFFDHLRGLERPLGHRPGRLGVTGHRVRSSERLKGERHVPITDPVLETHVQGPLGVVEAWLRAPQDRIDPRDLPLSAYDVLGFAHLAPVITRCMGHMEH